jgi:hypothetical protein
MGNRLRSQKAKLTTRVLALTLALAVVQFRPAFSSPGDIFTVSAPLATDTPAAGAPIADGDAAVSTQTGALTYKFQISLPPGRGKARPSLSLSYSSQAPTYGTLAAGWSLSGVPIITEDTSGGRLGSTTKKYTSSLSGDRPLIQVTEPGTGAAQYRAQNDSTWIRYERFVVIVGCAARHQCVCS